MSAVDYLTLTQEIHRVKKQGQSCKQLQMLRQSSGQQERWKLEKPQRRRHPCLRRLFQSCTIQQKLQTRVLETNTVASETTQHRNFVNYHSKVSQYCRRRYKASSHKKDLPLSKLYIHHHNLPGISTIPRSASNYTVPHSPIPFVPSPCAYTVQDCLPFIINVGKDSKEVIIFYCNDVQDSIKTSYFI